MNEEILKLEQSAKINAQNKDYGLMRNDYYVISTLYRKLKDQEKRLKYILYAIYVDLSGMSNNNTVENYNDMEWIFKTRLWREIKTIQNKLKLDDETLFKSINDIISNCKIELPFTYFNKDIKVTIIIEYLKGQNNLMEKYKNFRNLPNKNSRDYTFLDINY